MKSRIEHHFFKRSIEQFLENLNKMHRIISDETIVGDELLEIMYLLVAVKENIEALESAYLSKYNYK
jgi:hypothetical protein